VREAIDRFVDQEYEDWHDEEYGKPPGEPGKLEPTKGERR
jgi:hypothetical protein